VNPQQEVLAPNVILEWQAEGRIAIFHQNTANREGIDAYIQRLAEVTMQMRQAPPVLVLHDYRHSFFTPYARQKVTEFINRMDKDLQGRVAAVLPKTLAGELMRILAENLTRARYPHLQLRYFTDYGQGLAWLKEAL